MKGSCGKRSKTATQKDNVGTVGKPQVEEARLRSKPKVDYNENVLAFKGDVEKKSNQHGGKRKNVTKKNETSEDRRVESSKNHLDVKSSKAVRRLVLKRKTDVDHDAQSLVGSDHAEKQQQKRQRSYPDELKREIAEKVAEKGNMSEVARIYSTKLGFPVNKTTIRGIKAQVARWDAAEKIRDIQEDKEDMVAGDDERSSEDDPFKDEAGEKRRSQDESDEEDTAGEGDNSEAETDEEAVERQVDLEWRRP